MNREAPDTGDTGPLRLSAWFGVTGLLLLATLLAAAFVQVRQYALLNMTVQYQDDYLVLSLYQVEIEYLRLREQMREEADAPGGGTALQLRYDIFVSRVSLLGGDRAQRLITAGEASPQVLADIDSFIHRADLYLGAEPRGPLSQQAARALLTALEALGEPIHQVMLDASHRVAAQVTERQGQVRQHNRIGLALTGSLLAMVMVFAAIALRQMRQVEQRSRRLELLADQLRDARIEAESTSTAKSEFLADMSHELRTPLHGLLGMLSLVKDSPLDPRATDWLGTADESAQHLLRLMDDILDLSKLESGALALAPAPVALATLLREVQALLAPAASAKGLGLHVELDTTLPAVVRLDATRVRQVLFNLLANAIKYSEAGAIVLHVRRFVGGDGPAMLEFDVTDTGIGMDTGTVARLFRRFSRAESPGSSNRQGGTGLGLAISRNLARLMGGEIGVRSTPGAGSVFSFRCPLQTTDAAAVAPAPPGAANPVGRPLRVLVAEDHPVNRLYMAALLARLGHHAQLVDNGLAAVTALRDQDAAGAGAGAEPGAAAASTVNRAPFDLVLMDVHMPVMDGVAATEAIRALPGPASLVCVVALTADVFADTRQRCLDVGVSEVITKPLNLGALHQLLVRRFGHLTGDPSAPPGATPLPLTDSTDNSIGLLDRSTLYSVRDLMGAAEMPMLYGGFFIQAEDAARRMRDAMRDADTEALRRSAHSVKGAALNLGLPALAEAASLLNRDAATLAAHHLALAVQRYEEITAATRALCEGEGLLN